MTTLTGQFTETTVKVAETELYLLQGGSGTPVLVLHGAEGFEGWLPFHDALAERAAVYAPSHPGYGRTPCPEWLETIAHQAVFYHWFLQQQGLGPVDVVGIDIGGWIAAQMALMCPQHLRHLVLVDAAGIRPQHDEVFDIFITPWRQVLERAFYDAANAPEYQRLFGGELQEFGGPREAGRTMSMRMCFRPFFYDRALPGMLGKVRVPTLIVWGAQDRIIPVECGRLYQQSIPGATLQLMEHCGHWPQFERPQELARLVSEFTSRP
ncbi:MAG: alpha/beta hydrolase [Candidatus Tectomicrobia bacterium]|uniref:Alpha/beta hydrolase n=1 Tax=Tectimicrobiota bacterium TaxID=2528274 RepID=A0A937VXH2_UNCTE|nr:alpha/beta hydrolase [Candidatus Tectomicrobia bacterium]